MSTGFDKVQKFGVDGVTSALRRLIVAATGANAVPTVSNLSNQGVATRGFGRVRIMAEASTAGVGTTYLLDVWWWNPNREGWVRDIFGPKTISTTEPSEFILPVSGATMVYVRVHTFGADVTGNVWLDLLDP